VAGYEAGIRIGEFMGRSHYRIFHTTATVGTLAAAVAVAVGKLLDFDQEQFINLLGSAGTRLPGCGSSCAMPPTPSNCTRPRPLPMACSPRT
jgi:2-methylcitrate dehydratase PrpD